MSVYSRQTEQIEQLYRKMYKALLIYAKTVLNSPALAEEAVQDAFCIACEKSDELLGCGNPEGWIIKTLKYVAQNTLRQREKMGRMVMMTLNSEDAVQLAASDEEDINILYEDIFEAEEFQLFKHVVLDGCSMREASEEIGITLEKENPAG